MASIRAVIVGNRDPGGRFARVVDARQQACKAFAGRHAEAVASGWITRSTSSRVRSAIRTVQIAESSFSVSADSADVGFDPALREHDTVPHRIEPSKAHGLLGPMVLGGVSGRFVSGGVNHPGTTGDHALAETLEATKGDYRQGIADLWGG